MEIGMLEFWHVIVSVQRWVKGLQNIHLFIQALDRRLKIIQSAKIKKQSRPLQKCFWCISKNEIIYVGFVS